MSRVEWHGRAGMLDVEHMNVRYTLMILHDKHAAYEATPMDLKEEVAGYDPARAARYCFDHDANLDVADKGFINRWLELVGQRDSKPGRRTEEDEKPSVVKYGELKGI